MYTIIVTGACGFLGSNLCRRLLRDGHKIVGIDNLSCGFLSNIDDFIDHENFSFIKKDVRYLNVTDILLLNKTEQFLPIDYVYHLAALGELAFVRENPKEAVDVNVNGTLQVLEVSQALSCRHFIFTDTSAEYDALPVNDFYYPTHEDSIEYKYLPIGMYAITKLAASQFVRSFCKENNMLSTLVRPFNVYGPSMNLKRDIPPVIGSFAYKMLQSKSPVIYGDGHKKRDFIYVDDMIDFFVQIMETEEQFVYVQSRTLNAGTGNNYSIKEIYGLVSECIFGKDQTLWLEPVYVEEQSGEAEITLANISAAYYWLKWKPKVSIQEGIKKTVDSIRKELEN